MIALSFTSVVKVVVPVTAKAALSVITSPLRKSKLPATVPCTPKAVVPLSIVTCPAVPVVDIITFPPNAFVAVPKVIVASVAAVVSVDVPVTAKTKDPS